MVSVDPGSLINDPLGLSGGALLSGGDSGITPVANNKGNAIKSLNHKWAPDQIRAAQQAYGKDTTNALIKWELDRAQRGVPPTSVDATLKLLQSAKTKKAATAPADRDPMDFLGNAASDVGDLAGGIIKMPEQIASDVLQAPKTLDAIGKATSGGDPRDLLQAPIIRLIPGTYTAHNVLTGDVNEILSHPVMSALDVAPFARAAGLGEHLGKIPLGESTVGEKLAEGKAALGRTLPGQLARETFGNDTRQLVRVFAGKAADLHAAALPQMNTVFKDGVSQLRQKTTEGNLIIQKNITPERAPQIWQALEDPGAFGVKTPYEALDAINASDAELAAVQKFRENRDAYQGYGLDAGEVQSRVLNGVPEVLDTATAKRYDKGQVTVGRVRTLTNLRESILNPDAVDFPQLHEDVQAAINDPAQSTATRRKVAEGYVHALDAAGYDTGSLLSDISHARVDQLSNLTSQATGFTRTEGDTRTRRRTGIPGLQSSERWLEQHRQFTPKRLSKVEEAAAARESSILPARWQPTFQRLKVDKARGYIEQTFAADDPAVPGLLDRVNQHVYSDLDPEVQREINTSVLGEVAKLKSEGYNPEFIHHVSASQEASLDSPTVTSIIPKASQYGARLNDWTPGTNSLSVSLSHQGMELARRDVVGAALDQVRDPFTTSVREAEVELRAPAERAARRRGTTYGEELERLMKKEFVRWNETESGFMAGNAKAFKFSDTRFGAEDRLIRRPLANAMKMMASPPRYSRILDPVTGVFRYAVLPFSPRFHVNNIIGGLVSSAMEDPRVLMKVGEATAITRDLHAVDKAMRNGEFRDYSEATKAFLERIPDQLRQEFGGLKYSVTPDTHFRVKAGETLGDWAQKAGVDRLAKAGKSAADWSYTMNENVDMMYRISAYLSGEENALTKGLSAEEAAARGMALANKIQPRWLEMTPMERSVLRVVFPFYGFMSHLFRFAARFPADHPWRTAVMGSLARAELDDFGTGLPQALAQAFFIPGGGGTAITPGAANPFRDLGDNLTLAGFMGQTNPIFKAALVQLGYDPTQRGPNLYPEVEYDPKTGNFKSVTPNTPGVLGQLTTGLIPQANILAALTGTSGDFKNLMGSNPAAANRMLASSTGIPLLWRKYDLNTEAFDAELARQTDSKNVLANAMRTGDYSRAQRYPALRAKLSKLKRLSDAGMLGAFEYGKPLGDTEYDTVSQMLSDPQALARHPQAPNINTNAARVRATSGQATTQAEVGVS